MTDFRGGEAELLADDDRPGGWLLLIDRIRQSYVDLDDPTYLDFEYVQSLVDVIDLLPPGPLAVTHVGGGACSLARYVNATRPGSPQIVLEPDIALTALVRARLPFARNARIRIRPQLGRDGVAGLRDASADVLVLDAFHGGRVPLDLSTEEFFADVARVLKPGGVFLANVADGPPLRYTKALVAALRRSLPDALVRGDVGTVKARRFGNLIVAAARDGLPVDGIMSVAARAPFPQQVLSGRALGAFVGDTPPLTDARRMRSPAPPDEAWRVG